MKIKILFIWLMSLFAFCMGSASFTNNPDCRQVVTTKPLKKTTFMFILDRATVSSVAYRYMYLLKQMACMIPHSPLIDFNILHYTTEALDNEHIETHIDFNRVTDIIYGTGYDRESYNYEYCNRFSHILDKSRALMRQHLSPIENLQFIVPIHADADDAAECSMVDIFNEFFKNDPDRSKMHFNGIYIQGVSDPETRRNSSIFMDIPDIKVINIERRSMTNPPSSYTRKVKSIVDDIQAFIESKAFVEEAVSPTPVSDFNNNNLTAVNAALVQEDDNSNLILIIVVLLLIVATLVMIITMILCWAIMCKESKKKKKESKTRSASKDRTQPSKDSTGQTPRKGKKETPPRVSLSGMDSIDEFYIEPSAENGRTPQTKTPVTVTPQRDNTPKKPSFEDLDMSDRKNEDFEQGRNKRGYRNQKPPADFMVE